MQKYMTSKLSSDPNMLLLQMYYNNVQAEAYKTQIANLEQLKLNTKQIALDEEPLEVNKEIKILPKESVKVLPRPSYDMEITLEFHIKHIVNFLINNFGRINQRDLEAERQKYEFDQSLTQVFDTLVSKYAATTKTKEEMIKYVLRKALKNIKDKVKEGCRKNDKEAGKSFCQKYFNSSKEELLKMGVDIEDEDELLKLLLPFKKTSKNKTMNSNFLSKLFASDEFCSDYESYLNIFEKDAELDNNTKVKKFVTFILSCVKSKKTNSILNYKRVPWLKIWLNNTRNVGLQLMKDKSGGKKKKLKLEFEASSEQGASESDCKVEFSSTTEST